MIALASGTQVGPITWRGLLLITAYCLGLRLPFILLALGGTLGLGRHHLVRRHVRRVHQAGRVLLIAIGIALLTGLWNQVIAWLRGPISGFTIGI